MEIYEKTEIFNVLNNYNPWWQGKNSSIEPNKRIVFHELQKWVINPPAKRAILLSGARQVGKTTLMQQIIDDLIKNQNIPPENILYLTFDHPLIKLIGIEKTIDFWQELKLQKNKSTQEYLFLDEIQYAEHWQTWLKHQVDFHKERQITVTGSAIPLHKKNTESGVGRWHTIKLTTLSFYEFLQFKDIPTKNFTGIENFIDLQKLKENDLINLSVTARSFLPYFNEYITRGGFPQLINIDFKDAQKLIREDLLDKILKRDLTTIFDVRNVLDVENLFFYLCVNDGGIFNLNTVASNLGIQPISIANYLKILEAANLIYRLKPYASGKSILKGQPKIYLADPILTSSMLLNSDNVLQERKKLGQIIESIFLKHLYARYYDISPNFYYFRNPSDQKEVDIICKYGAEIIAFEAKYSLSQVTCNKLKGLITLLQKENVTRSYVITGNDSDLGYLKTDNPELKKKIFLIPAHIACLIAGKDNKTILA